jgi:hypothetical protein
MTVSRNTVRSALASDAAPACRRRPAGSIVDAVEPQIRELLQAYPTMLATVIAERIGWTRSIRVLRGGTTDQQLDRCARLRAPGPATPSSTAPRSGQSAPSGHRTGDPGLPSRPPTPARHLQPGWAVSPPPTTPAAANRALRLGRYPMLVVCGSWGCGAMREALLAATSGQDAQNSERAETRKGWPWGCDLSFAPLSGQFVNRIFSRPSRIRSSPNSNSSA